MSNQNGISSVKMVENFTKDMEAFIAYAKQVVNQNEYGRTKFPDFIITDVIRQKVQSANTSLKAGKLAKAISSLKDVQKHFQNQQAAWAKNLQQGLVDDLTGLTMSKCPDDLLAPVRKAVEKYTELMSQSYFDLDEASTLYWSAIDALNKAENSWESYVTEQRRKASKISRAQKLSKPTTCVVGFFILTHSSFLDKKFLIY